MGGAFYGAYPRYPRNAPQGVRKAGQLSPGHPPIFVGCPPYFRKELNPPTPISCANDSGVAQWVSAGLNTHEQVFDTRPSNPIYPLKTSKEQLMKFRRLYSAPGDPYAGLNFEPRTSRIVNPDGSVIFEAKDVMVPEGWSQVAVDVLAQKYCRKAGVPKAVKPVAEEGVPEWLWRSVADESALESIPRAEQFGAERDSRQVFNRMAGCWTYWGWKYGYFDSESDARVYYDEMSAMLARQIGAPNSPQWFNTGLFWAYGIAGPAQGHYFVDPRPAELRRWVTANEHPAPHGFVPYRAVATPPDG